MAIHDLDKAYAIHAALLALFIQEHGGTSKGDALARTHELCEAAVDAVNDVESRVAVRGVKSLAALLYSDDGHLGISIGNLHGVHALRLQIANELSAFRGRLELLESRKPSRPEIPAVVEPKHLHVLVVEDNRDSAESLRRLLQLCGYAVTIAETAKEGLDAARSIRPDVILCDIGLPDADGFSLARALRKNPETSTARLIAVTAYGKDEDREQSKKAGFALHLLKPVSPGTLLGVLEDLPRPAAVGEA
jgi:CheY-like chemotaxis protein